MAFVLKEYSPNSKGIFMFNHKEMRHFFNNSHIFSSVLNKLKEKYIIGMHFGYVYENLKDTPFIDFYMSGAGTITLAKETKTPFIKIGSRDFIPEFFKPNKNVQKYWDVAYFGHIEKRKGIEDFFKTLRMVMNKRPETKSIFLMAVPEKMDKYIHYTTLWEDYKNWFTAEEQKNISLFTVLTKGQIYPIPSETVAHLMQQTRVLGMFSYGEGHPRVVHEALSCGVPVLVRRELKGGAHDNINETNSRLFSNNEEATEKIIEMLNNPLTVNTEEIVKWHKAEFTRPRLVKEMQALFKERKENFEGELNMESLHRKLSGHLQLLPRKYCGLHGDDLKSKSAIVCFVSDILNIKHPSKLNLIVLDLDDLPLKLKMLVRKPAKWCINRFYKIINFFKGNN